MEMQARDRERFEREYLEVYGEPAPAKRTRKTPKSQETESPGGTS